MADYVSMSVCDLRTVRTVEEARKITSIVSVKLLVLPNDVPEEVSAALTDIPKTSVGQMIYLGKDEELDASKYLKKQVVYKDIRVLDLRSITTVEAAEAIEEIKRVNVLIVPSDGQADVCNAIMNIPKKGIGKVIRASLEEEIDYSQLEAEIASVVQYNDMDILDLRQVNSVEALQKIKKINDIAVLVLPADASPEVQTALAAIPRNDIGKTIYLKDGEPVPYKVQKANGLFMMEQVPKTSVIITVNGVCIIPELPGLKEDISIVLFVNGMCLLHSSLRHMDNLEISVNGAVFYEEFDSSKLKMVPSMDIDAATISYMPEGVVMLGQKLSFAEDVTPEMMMEKKLKILAAERITASKQLLPYLKATASMVNKLVESDTKDKDGDKSEG